MVAILVGAYYDPGAALGAVITGWKGMVGAQPVPLARAVGGVRTWPIECSTMSLTTQRIDVQVQGPCHIVA